MNTLESRIMKMHTHKHLRDLVQIYEILRIDNDNNAQVVTKNCQAVVSDVDQLS